MSATREIQTSTAEHGSRTHAREMKAIVQNTYGSADVLELRDVDPPVAGDQDVLVRVLAASANIGDWHLMTGTPYAVRAVAGLRAPKARVRGTDVAGRVEAVGKDVAGFAPGDEVFGVCDGSFAELALARPDKLARKPAFLSFEQAATVPTSGCAALQAVRRTKVRPGQTVLIVGAAGGVGSFAVQIAKANGAHVTGVCSTAKVELVRSLGADEVIDYTRDDLTAPGKRYDVILDIAGSRSVSQLRKVLAPKGTLVIVGGEGGGSLLGMRRQLGASLLSAVVDQSLGTFIAKVTAEDLEALKDLIEAGRLTPSIGATYPLAEVPDAIRYLAEGHATGKVSIKI